MRGSKILGICLPGYTEKEVLSAVPSALKPRQSSLKVEGAKDARRVEIRLSSQESVFQDGTFFV